ncbi:hypothetical protein BH23ACT9_BH23ACT9_24250 [soil metagenome]
MSAQRRTSQVLMLLLVAALLSVPTPAAAESGCVADAAGDVEDIATREVADRPEADILAVCVTHTAAAVEITVRVAAPTDPETDPTWDDFGSAVGAAISVDGTGDEDFDVNYARLEDGQIGVVVFRHRTTTELCRGQGTFDGSRYRITVQTGCLGNPAEVWVAPFMFYRSSPMGQSRAGFYDEVPDRPGFLGPYTTAADRPTGVERLAGGSRIDTAIAISQDDFPLGGADGVVLARAETFPDALVAAPLAVAVNGPMLLTGSFGLAPQVEEELRRVLPAGGTVHLSGGESALSDDVRAEVEALGYDVLRAAGPTRYATSVAIARAASAQPDLIVVADGNDFPDALVGGALAGAEAGVEILSNGPELTAETVAYLAENPQAEVVAIGSVAAQAVPTATPFTGADPFATSVAVAQARYDDVDAVALASGTNFPDGLAGGAHAGRRGVPLLLTWPDILPASVADHLAAIAPLDRVYAYGGVAALSQQIEASAQTALE